MLLAFLPTTLLQPASKTRFSGEIACVLKQSDVSFLPYHSQAAILAKIGAAKSVKEITADDFDSVVGKNKNVLLNFYASWCAPCAFASTIDNPNHHMF